MAAGRAHRADVPAAGREDGIRVVFGGEGDVHGVRKIRALTGCGGTLLVEDDHAVALGQIHREVHDALAVDERKLPAVRLEGDRGGRGGETYP